MLDAKTPRLEIICNAASKIAVKVTDNRSGMTAGGAGRQWRGTGRSGLDGKLRLRSRRSCAVVFSYAGGAFQKIPPKDLHAHR